MTADHHGWSLRSAVLSVRDLDRSSAFYQDVMAVREIFREKQIAVLSNDRSPSFNLFLREANRDARHPGQQALGVRSLSCDVGSLGELDRVEARLHDLNGFVLRKAIDSSARFEIVQGHDPDRTALVFVAAESNLAIEDYRRILASLYVVDV